MQRKIFVGEIQKTKNIKQFLWIQIEFMFNLKWKKKS